MASLLAKDTYLQSLARKICAQPSPEPQKRTSGKEQPRAGTGRASRGAPLRRQHSRLYSPPQRWSVSILHRTYFRWNGQVDACNKPVKHQEEILQGMLKGSALLLLVGGTGQTVRRIQLCAQRAGSSAGLWRT